MSRFVAVFCIAVTASLAAQSTSSRGDWAHPTAVAVSGEFRRYYKSARTVDWQATRSGVPGPSPGVDTWGGIASHHLLAAPLIHDWFRELARARVVEEFLVVAPRHFRQGYGSIVTTMRRWDGGERSVEAGADTIGRLVGEGVLAVNDSSFYREHGIGTLVPFIAEYFPGARIVPILIDQDSVYPEELTTLARAIDGELAADADTFLLLSADFSHHRGPSETARVDEITARILADLTPETARRAYTDNTRGLEVLAAISARRGAEISIRSQSDSWLLWGRDAEDTTSYIFAFIR